ncbi:translation initiation factor IF-2 [Membranihabitans marinus]|uniref:translation initiation factor IF-2 n=1 Tax=Membranihabitans marinus TaxID=1227546 RepID=UPI001F00492B|nr:translation initiation factor IF-2 [Membranihabitans marinus]
MSKRLVKIAKELNVGTGSIVDFLSNKGFDIDNKPTAKVSDEMYDLLVHEFQGSMAVKEQADQLIIGTNRQHKDEVEKEVEAKVTPPAPKPSPVDPVLPKKEVPPAPPKEEVVEVIQEPVAEEPVVEQEVPVVEEKAPEVPVVEEVKQEEVAPVKEEVAPVIEEKEEKKEEEEEVKKPVESGPEKMGLKVVGKIDLTPKKKAKKTEKSVETPPAKPDSKEEKVAKEPVKPKEEVAAKEVSEKPKADVVVEKPAADKPEVKKAGTADKAESKPVEKVEQEKPAAEEAAKADEEKSEDGGLIRANAPQLKGLKIMGKINTAQFEKPKKSKKDSRKKDVKTDTTKKADGTAKEGSKEADEAATRKKRRRRTKVVTQDNKSGGGANRKTTRGGRPSKSKQEEQKEVTHKEIEDQIKATMARLNNSGKNKRQKTRRDKRENIREKEELKQLQEEDVKLEVTEFISVQELANLMNVSATDVIMTCMNMGVIVSINQRLDAEIIELVAEEYGHELTFVDAEEKIDIEDEFIDNPEDIESRAPIVTVMGHVDHGKTSLLDYIRKENVAGGEAGGITQHIGAYEVVVGENNKKITFLDTPGHEAFTAMRARGAKVTDVAVIIVAADDRIMPQTKEAISHAQAAGVPIIFAINKIDKPGADPERIKQELASMNFLVEDWGGKFQSQEISAKNGTNIDLLLEKILLESELLELEANPNRPAYGTVIEASLDKGRGYVSKMLVQNGTLKIGDAMVAGEHAGKVKAMFNENGKRVKTAGPSRPVLVLGLSGAPQAGEKFKILESEQETKQLAAKRAQIIREQTNRASKRISLDEIGRRLALGNFKELNLIVKGDVDGSVEALADSLIKLSVETIQVNVIHKGVGQIIESDVLLATASDAIIIGFQVRPSLNARKLAEQEGVEIKTYSIIYNAIEEITMAMEGMLEPTKEEKITAQLEVRETFKVSKIGTVAGCYVLEGTVNRNNFIRVIRDGIVVYPSKEGAVAEISSLKRYKEDVREVKTGIECGVTVKNFNDLKPGDNLETYEVIEVKQTLN